MSTHYLTITIRDAQQGGDCKTSVKNLEIEGEKEAAAFTASLRKYIKEAYSISIGD